jgi:hypothetical protein
MSDSAFKTAPYPSYTTNQLKGFIADGKGNDVMRAEIERRAAVAAGDYSQATAGERLRRVRALS